jgi:hypothetical protein
MELITAVKKFYNRVPMAQSYKLFSSIIYEFLFQARVFVRLSWKSLPRANTLT